MSKKSNEVVPCPDCQANVPFVLWQSLNAQLDPSAKEQLLNGSLFAATCPECHATKDVLYPILYHDMTNQVMIALTLDDEMAEEYYKVFASKDAKPGLDFMGEMNRTYRYRFVRNPNELREKVMIFDLGLDDRIVEIAKVMFEAKFYESHPGRKVLGVFFSHIAETNDAYELRIVLEDNYVAEIKLRFETYKMLSARFADVDILSQGCFTIDRNWAVEALRDKSE